MNTYSTTFHFPVEMKERIQLLSRMNFYLWMYVAREGDYDDAMEFIRSMRNVPAPFEDWYAFAPLCEPEISSFLSDDF